MFADVRELSTEKKLVKTVFEQEECESRKIWRDVTVGLRINDMDKATAAKCAIEQKQRDEARFRKENNMAWQTKVRVNSFIVLYYTNAIELYHIYLIFLQQLFKETKDNGWMYVKPLVDRICHPSNQSNIT